MAMYHETPQPSHDWATKPLPPKPWELWKKLLLASIGGIIADGIIIYWLDTVPVGWHEGFVTYLWVLCGMIGMFVIGSLVISIACYADSH